MQMRNCVPLLTLMGIILLSGCDKKNGSDPNDPDTVFRLDVSSPASGQEGSTLFNNPFIVLKFNKSIGFIDEQGVSITPSDNLVIDDVDILGGFDYDDYDDRTHGDHRFAKTDGRSFLLREKFIKSIASVDEKAAQIAQAGGLSKAEDDVINSTVIISVYRRDNFPVLYDIGETYHLRIESDAIRDIFGNPLEDDIEIVFTPETVFRVGDVWPRDGDLAPHGMTTLSVYFNGQIQSIAQNALRVTPEMSMTPNVSHQATAVEFYASTPFVSGQSYALTLSKDVASIGGQTLGRDFQSSFSVGQAQVESFEPDPGELVTELTRSITVQYNIQISAGTITFQPSLIGSSFINYQSITFTPTNGLKAGTTYVATLTGVKDEYGHAVVDTSFTFTTDAFRIQSSDPVPQATLVARNKTVLLNFNGYIDNASLNAATITFSPAVAFNRSLYYTNQGILLDPTGNFTATTPYTLTVNGIKNKQGDLMQPYTLHFTSEAPRVWGITGSYPANGSTDLPTYQDFLFYVNEDIADTSLANGYTITPSISGSISDHGDHIHYYPSTLKVGKTYTINLKSTIRNVLGDPMTPYAYSFSTAPFKVTNTSPSNGSTGVYRGAFIYVNFNAYFLAETADSAFTISPSAPGSLYPSGQTLYWYPSVDLNANTTYTVSINNRLLSTDSVAVQPYSFSFTTGN